MTTKKTQQVELSIYRWWRQPSGRLAHGDKHFRRLKTSIPTDLPGILLALAKRTRSAATVGYRVHDVSGGGLAIEAWSGEVRKAGRIAQVVAWGLNPSLKYRRDLDSKRWTLVPERLYHDLFRTYTADEVLAAFTEKEREDWIYSKPKRDVELNKGLRLMIRISKAIRNGKASVAELDRFVRKIEERERRRVA